jgi:hypothetical protein
VRLRPLTWVPTVAMALSAAAGGGAPAKLPHPAVVLLDEHGVNVLRGNTAISTRRTCGDCHDYDFITDSFHFQQGHNEMDPALLKAHGIAPFNSSPGMFGKFSIIPNRQLTHQGITDPQDFDQSTPEWLSKCGVCHTGGGISELDMHGRKLGTVPPDQIDPLDPDYHTRVPASGEIVPWDWKASGTAEGDCFICHVPGANRKARKEMMVKGRFGWADTATLAGTAIVEALEDGTLRYKASAFNPDGTVKPEALDLSDPALESCAQCHGFTARSATTIQPIVFGDIMRGTEKAGWIYNAARISDTVKPNVVGKEALAFPWDVHAAKNLICIDCHFSPNNPGRMIHSDTEKNLRYKPIQEDIATYLKRPDHNFARGNIPPETVNMTRHNTMRGCGECHDTARTHEFLPYKEIHFANLACQTCHIPAIHFWAYRSDEWGFLMDTGTSRITFRGIEGEIVNPDAKVTGFRPAYIVTNDPAGHPQIRPTNLITGVYWFDATKGRPVFTRQVQKAFFDRRDEDGTWIYRPKVLAAFDRDKDGFILSEEAVYDSSEKIALVKKLLQKYGGVTEPELRIDIVPWAMSHSTVGKDQAVRECTACHARKSLLQQPLELDDVLPRGVPVYYGGARHDLVRWTGTDTVFNNTELLSPFYIIGNSRVLWVEILGWMAVAGALGFALVHGALRLILGGRRS